MGCPVTLALNTGFRVCMYLYGLSGFQNLICCYFQIKSEMEKYLEPHGLLEDKKFARGGSAMLDQSGQ